MLITSQLRTIQSSTRTKDRWPSPPTTALLRSVLDAKTPNALRESSAKCCKQQNVRTIHNTQYFLSTLLTNSRHKQQNTWGDLYKSGRTHGGSYNFQLSNNVNIFQALRKFFLPSSLLRDRAVLVFRNARRERWAFWIFVERVPAKYGRTPSVNCQV